MPTWDRPVPDKDFLACPTWTGAVTNWFYQLQDVNPMIVATVKADVKVVDPTEDGRKPWNRSAVDMLRGLNKSHVLAYLSIGEAEDYRAYWDRRWTDTRLPTPAAPNWLSKENPEWKGNYKVQYWDPEWQRIVFRQLDEIVHQGFDGVYLDIIDAYEYWEDLGHAEAPALMVEFVEALAARARRINPDFWIVPQNGDGLLKFEPYCRCIDAIAREDLFFGGNGDKPNDYATLVGSLKNLDRLRAMGKTVLVVEYLTKGSRQAEDAITAAYKFGYVPYITTRELNKPTEPC